MKKMMMAMVIVVAMTMVTVMPVMAATRSENRTSWQEGQLEIATDEIRNDEIDVTMHVKKPNDNGDRNYDMVICTDHYRWNIYYTSETYGYGSLYFKDGTFITSLTNDDLEKTSF